MNALRSRRKSLPSGWRQQHKYALLRERLEQGKKECAEKNKAQPHKEKSAPEL